MDSSKNNGCLTLGEELAIAAEEMVKGLPPVNQETDTTGKIPDIDWFAPNFDKPLYGEIAKFIRRIESQAISEFKIP